MAKAREQPKDRELALRARKMAYLLEGRIFGCKDGVYLVSGMPDFPQLLHCLQSFNMAPTAGYEPGPIQLGFSHSQIQMVTEPLLAHLGRALQKWRKIIRDKDARKTQKKSDKHELKRWKIETAFLGKRLDCLHKLLRDRTSAGTENVVYIPADTIEDHFLTAHEELLSDRHVPDAWAWYGTVSLWIGGSESLRRYIQAIRPHLLTPTQQEKREQAEHIKALLVQWIDQLHNIAQNTPAEFNRACHILLGDVHRLLTHQAERSLENLKIGRPSKPHDLLEYLVHSVDRCDQFLKTIKEQPSHKNVAGIAALCACDGSSISIPKGFIGAGIKGKDFNALFSVLVKESVKDGYDRLLDALDQIDEIFQTDVDLITDIREILLAGAHSNDITWLASQDYQRSHFKAFSKKKLSPAPVRELIGKIETLGVKCSYEEIDYSLEQIEEVGDVTIARVFCMWLDNLPRLQLEPNTVRGIWNSFLEALTFSGLGKRFFNLIRGWAFPPTRKYKLKGVEDVALSNEARQWLCRLAFYQEFSGHEIGLTKSLLKLFDGAKRVAMELEHLKREEEQGSITEIARKRLRSLEKQVGQASPNERKVLRKIREVCAQVALEGLNHLLRKETERLWGDFCQLEPDVQLRTSEKLEILRWSGSLEGRTKKRLKELLDAWEKEAGRYKRALEANKPWFSIAEAKGIDVEAWLYPNIFTMAPQKGTSPYVGTSQDPFRMFLMGSYFDTCLELREGINRDAVLSNTYEANKSVLYVTDERGIVVGRKLVGLNAEGQMVGFHTYLSVDKALRTDLKRRIHAYCGEWARSCGAMLSNFGSPECLTELFWYDDGIEPWLPCAHVVAGRQIEESGDEKVQSPHSSPLLPVLLSHWEHCVRRLKRFGLWPPKEGTDPKTLFNDAPRFVEEILADMAVAERDKQILAHLYQHAVTPGGRIATFMAQLELDPKELLNLLPFDNDLDVLWKGSGADRVAGILAELESRNAIEKLAYMCLQDFQVSSLNLVEAARKSERACEAILNFFLRERYWFCTPSYLQLLIYFITLTTGRTPSDRFLCRAIVHDNRERPNCGVVLPQLAPHMGQWLPRLRYPERAISYKLLASVWNNSPLEEASPEALTASRLGIVLWCLRNPCSATLRFLRKHSFSNPVALLGLAIASPRRFGQQVEKGFQNVPQSPAAIMSLIAVKGWDEGMRFMASEMPMFPDSNHLLYQVGELYRAFEDMNWMRIAGIQEELKGYDLQCCLPFLMWNLWARLECDTEEVDIGCIKPDETAAAVWASGVDVFGLCLQIAKRLRDCSERTAKRFRQMLHALFQAKSAIWMPGELRLWLNVISGHRLYTEDFLPFIDKTLSFDDEIKYTGAYRLFFDVEGNRHPASTLEWEGISLAPVVFPFLPEQMSKLADLLVEKAAGQDPRECFGFRPSTEFESRFIDRFLDKFR